MKLNKKIFLTVILSILCLSGCKESSGEEHLAGQSEVQVGDSQSKESSEEEHLAVYKKTLDIVDEINQNSDFGGLKLLQPSELTAEEASEYGDDHPEMASGPEAREVHGLYFNYPADSEKRYLSQIYIFAKPYHVYGITVEHSLEEARAILTGKGFVEIESYRVSGHDNEENIPFKQDDAYIIIKINKDNDAIITITTLVAQEDTGEEEIEY